VVSRHHARSARRERQAAQALGTRRVVRERGASAPDVFPARLPSGVTVQAEVKERAAPLLTVERWLSQAEGYARAGALPLLVVFATGQRADDALVVMRLADFRRVAGLEPEREAVDCAQTALRFEEGE
jgi:hypothetical protein